MNFSCGLFFAVSRIHFRFLFGSRLPRANTRRIYLRANLTRTAEGYEVTPAKNQSSGLFGPIQKTNCLAVMPEGTEPQPAGSIVDCLLLDIPEEVVL